MAGIRSSKAQWRFVIRNIQWNQSGYRKANLVVYCHSSLITHLAPSTDLGYHTFTPTKLHKKMWREGTVVWCKFLFNLTYQGTKRLGLNRYPHGEWSGEGCDSNWKWGADLAWTVCGAKWGWNHDRLWPSALLQWSFC